MTAGELELIGSNSYRVTIYVDKLISFIKKYSGEISVINVNGQQLEAPADIATKVVENFHQSENSQISTKISFNNILYQNVRVYSFSVGNSSEYTNDLHCELKLSTQISIEEAEKIQSEFKSCFKISKSQLWKSLLSIGFQFFSTFLLTAGILSFSSIKLTSVFNLPFLVLYIIHVIFFIIGLVLSDFIVRTIKRYLRNRSVILVATLHNLTQHTYYTLLKVFCSQELSQVLCLIHTVLF